VNAKCDVVMKLSVFGTRTYTIENLYILAKWAVTKQKTKAAKMALKIFRAYNDIGTLETRLSPAFMSCSKVN